MAQMTILTRQDIEGCLKRGMNIPQIAAKVGKTPQAITAELKTRQIDSNKGLHRSNAICKWYRECRRTRVCDTSCGRTGASGSTRPTRSRTGSVFVKTYGYDGRRFLDRLGVVKIPANEVTLDPHVLGKRFKRHAERIILRKNGVTK